MQRYSEKFEQREMVVGTIIVLVLLFILLLLGSYILTRGLDDNVFKAPSGTNTSETQPTNQTDLAPPESSGGSTGGGTGNSNDLDITTPSPAGGVDTNNNPAGNGQ